MTALNKQALREAAENATAGQWVVELGDEVYAVDGDDSEQIAMVFSDNGRSDAAFIAAASPVAVLSLLDENLQLQRDKDSLEAVAIAMRDDMWNAREKLEAAEKRNAELQSENAYIRNRHKELDLLIGKNILVMQAAIIEWQATGDAKNGLAWIYNTLFGPGELPDESEKDAQAYFDRKYAPIDEELMALHKWFWEQSEAERAAAGIGVKGE
ncbi:ead/Ea22-like family protein [Citrobacter freundii]|uniref:ead/Ea22-like family protein n=1 Tax=Citrobacter freundii TaxID=546 RepID=UPI001C7CD8F6|nr:ead/Ea22-like family protein [Citrobacter freundii]WOD69713.1 ead/Ea22-like family protein [Citrobacter freundii]